MNKEVDMIDKRHGGPYDRGSADAWYGREFDPHYFVGATHDSERIDSKRMTICQQLDYTKGYNETPFAQKDWGTFE
jgi:hypothetical protein